MSNADLLNASEKWDFKLVQQLLANKSKDINCKDILNKKAFIKKEKA